MKNASVAMFFMKVSRLNKIFSNFMYFQKDPVTNICQAADKQLFTLVEWAKRIPHFTDLPLDDQVILLRAGSYAGIIKDHVRTFENSLHGNLSCRVDPFSNFPPIPTRKIFER